MKLKKLAKTNKHKRGLLKTLFSLTVESRQEKAGTNQIAEYLSVSPPSVSNMLKKLKKKELIRQEKYRKLELTDKGKAVSVWLIR